MKDTESRHSRPIIDTSNMPLNLTGVPYSCAACGAEADCDDEGWCRVCQRVYRCCGMCCASIRAMVKAHSKRHAGLNEVSYLTEIEDAK